MDQAEIFTVPDVAMAALPVVTDALLAAVAQRGKATLVLSGGSTPLPLYERLAMEELPWESVHLLWGDERFVPLGSPDSNAGAALAVMERHVRLPQANVHPWPILDSPAEAAVAYASLIEDLLGGEPFDVTLLGLGADGHTASIFPGTGDVFRTGLTLATEAPPTSPVHDRLTLGTEGLDRSRNVIFLARGADKLPALRGTFGREASGGSDAGERARLDRYPAAAIRPLERLIVFTDQDLQA